MDLRPGPPDLPIRLMAPALLGSEFAMALVVRYDRQSAYAASMVVVGRPQRAIRSILGHIVTGALARNLLRHSPRPVVAVSEFAGNP
jgi:hypothetical protein